MLDELPRKSGSRYSNQLQELMAEEQRCADVANGDTVWEIDF